VGLALFDIYPGDAYIIRVGIRSKRQKPGEASGKEKNPELKILRGAQGNK
jgi:hypothetical protein